MKLIAFVNGMQLNGEFDSFKEISDKLLDDFRGTLVVRPAETPSTKYHAILPGGITTPHFSSQTGAINCALAEINAYPAKYIEVKAC
jgi:hypothetical protein